MSQVRSQRSGLKNQPAKLAIPAPATGVVFVKRYKQALSRVNSDSGRPVVACVANTTFEGRIVRRSGELCRRLRRIRDDLLKQRSRTSLLALQSLSFPADRQRLLFQYDFLEVAWKVSS